MFLNLASEARVCLNKAMAQESLTGHCEKKGATSPDCAKCEVFTQEDFRDELAAPASGDEFASLCFRLFHRDLKERARWRRKLCKHFRES